MYCKGSASRRQCKEKTKVFSFGIVETQPTLSKGSTNRREYKINSFIFILEVPPTFTAGAVNSANRREYKINLFIFILEVQPTFTAGAVKGQVEDNAKKKQMFFPICIVEATPTLSIDSASGGSRRVASMI